MALQHTLLIVHILAAAIWIGGGVVALLLGSRLAQGDDPAPLARYCRDLGKLGGPVFGGSGGIVLLSGGWLTSAAGFEFSQTWVIVGLVGWLASTILGAGPVSKTWVKVGQQLDAGESLEATRPLIARAQMISWIDVGIRTAVVVLMVVKPG